jgi:hypothetical protein
LTDSSANTVGDKTIKAGIKCASIAPNSCDFFMVIHRQLFIIYQPDFFLLPADYHFYRVRIEVKA